MSTSNEKRLERQKLHSIRKELFLDEIKKKKIANQVFFWLDQSPWKTIGFYYPIYEEIDLFPCIKLWSSLDKSRQASLPVIENNTLIFKGWSTQTKMTYGYKGIPEPHGTQEIKPEVILIPCIGYDKSKFRLGYGGGWFDRYLACHRNIKTVGICYERCLLDSIHPQPHDIPMDWIITENQIF